MEQIISLTYTADTSTSIYTMIKILELCRLYKPYYPQQKPLQNHSKIIQIHWQFTQISVDLSKHRLHKDLLISHSFLNQNGQSWAHFKAIPNLPWIEALVSAEKITLSIYCRYKHVYLCHHHNVRIVPLIGAILSAAKIPSEWFQDHPNPLRIHSDISRSLQQSIPQRSPHISLISQPNWMILGSF